MSAAGARAQEQACALTKPLLQHELNRCCSINKPSPGALTKPLLQAVSATGAQAQEQARAAEMARAKEQGKGRADKKAGSQAPPGMPSRRLGTAGGLRGTDAGAPRYLLY